MATGPLAAGIRRPLAAGIALVLSAATLTTAQTAVASPSQKKGSLIHSATGNLVRVAYKGGNYSAPRKKVGAGGTSPAVGRRGPRLKLIPVTDEYKRRLNKDSGLGVNDPFDKTKLLEKSKFPHYEERGFNFMELIDADTGVHVKAVPIPTNPTVGKALVAAGGLDVKEVAIGLLHSVTVPAVDSTFSPDLKDKNFPPVVNLPIVWNVPPPREIVNNATVGAITIQLRVTPVEAYLLKGAAEAEPLATCPGPSFGKPWAKGMSVNDPNVCTVTYNEPHEAETLSVGMVWVSTMTSNITVGEDILEVTSVESDYSGDIYERHALTTGRP